jgi:enoyl-CoA hydratase/carnithine racemase
MRGYFDDPDATAAWCPDGWARTGDQVAIDNRGRPRFVGRRRDLIRRGGHNIAAAEVEAALAEHPGVRHAACVPVPDDVRGEEVKAYVVTTSPGAVSPEALVAFVRDRLAPFKAPRYVEIVAALPMTPSERVAKPLLGRTVGPRTYDADEPIALREVTRLVARADSIDLDHMLELETYAVLACLADPQLARRVRARVGDRAPDPSPGPDVRVDRTGRLAIITLSRPHVANALRARSCDELAAILDALAADPSVAGVILTGAGRTFSAGEDLRELVAGLPGSAAAVLPVVQDLTRRIAAHPTRVVAAVNGPAVGLGAELAIACHAAVAARGAFLSFPEAQLGLLPTNGAFHFVTRRAGPAMALEWFRTGAPVPVEAAARAGVLTRVVAAEDLADAAAALALGGRPGARRPSEPA